MDSQIKFAIDELQEGALAIGGISKLLVKEMDNAVHLDEYKPVMTGDLASAISGIGNIASSLCEHASYLETLLEKSGR